MKSSLTSLSRSAAIWLSVGYAGWIAAYYLFLASKRETVAPEVLHDAIYNPVPAFGGGICGILLWVFWGEQINAWKERRRAQLRRSKFKVLATDLRRKASNNERNKPEEMIPNEQQR